MGAKGGQSEFKRSSKRVQRESTRVKERVNWRQRDPFVATMAQALGRAKRVKESQRESKRVKESQGESKRSICGNGGPSTWAHKESSKGVTVSQRESQRVQRESKGLKGSSKEVQRKFKESQRESKRERERER